MKQLLIWLLAITPTFLWAQELPKTVQDAAASTLMFTEGRILDLAEAIPENKYDWRPMEGVRSIGEALVHVAVGNYLIVMLAGHTPPEGLDLMTMETSVTGKENIKAAIKESYNYARAGVAAMSKKQLGDKVEFPFPGNYNKLSAIMIVTGHCHEHMGQLIAYARMNGITPPWSENQDSDGGQ